MSKKVVVKDTSISFVSYREDDYISLTDIARYKNEIEPQQVILLWIRSQSSIEFLATWEKINNLDFKGVEIGTFRNKPGNKDFRLSVEEWVAKTNAIGIFAKRGRYNGGTYAHKDIAFEFASWVSPEFKLYLIKEFQRLKIIENERLAGGWSLRRELAKVNYKIHTDAIKEHMIPPLLSPQSSSIIYATEADVLNVALFGITAQEWRNQNPQKEGNIRDYSSVEQLVVLSNMESLNAELIRQGLLQEERLRKLNEIAIYQMKSLLKNNSIKKLK